MSKPHQDRQAFQELALAYEFTVDQELQKAWGISYPHLVEQILQFANVQETETLLDLATGTGLIPRSMATQPGSGHHLVGLDITFRALDLGKKKIRSSPLAPLISFTCASALALPFKPGAFDCVICALATHHLDQDDLLDQVYTVLKPNGRFILADVIASPSWRFPGVKTCLRLAAYSYFLITGSPARAWVESKAVTNVYTEAEWATALYKYNFSSIQVRQPNFQNTWLPSGTLMSAVKVPR